MPLISFIIAVSILVYLLIGLLTAYVHDVVTPLELNHNFEANGVLPWVLFWPIILAFMLIAGLVALIIRVIMKLFYSQFQD